MSLVAEADARTAVNVALRGHKHQLGGMLFRFGLLATLLLALAILLVLIVTTLVDAWPVLTTRGWDFVKSDTSSLAERAGVWQGLVGSLILTGFVAGPPNPISRLTVASLKDLGYKVDMSKAENFAPTAIERRQPSLRAAESAGYRHDGRGRRSGFLRAR